MFRADTLSSGITGVDPRPSSDAPRHDCCSAEMRSSDLDDEPGRRALAVDFPEITGQRENTPSRPAGLRQRMTLVWVLAAGAFLSVGSAAEPNFVSDVRP